ncbi:hypothetical protein ACTM5Z_004343 [Salmonella enterica]
MTIKDIATVNTGRILKSLDTALYFIIIISVPPYLYFFTSMTLIAVTGNVYLTQKMECCFEYTAIVSIIVTIWNMVAEPEFKPLLARVHITEELKVRRPAIKIIINTFGWSLIALMGITLNAYPYLYQYQAAQSIQRWINENEAFTQSITRDQYQRANEGKADAILWVVEHNPKESWRLNPLIEQGNGDAIMQAAAIATRNNSQEADKLLHDAAAQGNEQALRLLYKIKVATHD